VERIFFKNGGLALSIGYNMPTGPAVASTNAFAFIDIVNTYPYVSTGARTGAEFRRIILMS
jgi:hypothetical protein